MKATFLHRAILGAAVFVAAGSAMAHHSFAAIWDDKQSFSITGTLTKVDWVNPHSYFFVDVKDKGGKVETYAFEGMAPMVLKRLGLNKGQMTSQIGHEVTVRAYPARDGTKTLGFGQSYKFADGTTLVIVPDGSAPPAR